MKKFFVSIVIAVSFALAASVAASAQELSDVSSIVPGRLTYASGHLYSNGIKLMDSEIENMLPGSSLKSYLSGRKMYTAGEVLIIVGSVVEGAGIAMALAGSLELVKSFTNDQPYRLRHGAMVVTGEAAMFVGFGCLGAGIPLYCVGKHRIKKVGEEYNVSKGYPDVALKVGSTGNGFGLSLNF